MLKNIKYRASLTCQVRTNIRVRNEISYQTLAKIFKKELPYDQNRHLRYFLGFFEECYPSIIKGFMAEQNVSRDEIINIFNKIPDRGEKRTFERALQNGEF